MKRETVIANRRINMNNFILLCLVFLLASCIQEDSEDIDGAKKVKIGFIVNSGDGYSDDLIVMGFYDDKKDVASEEHEIITYTGDVPQTLLVTDDYGNLIMMSRELHFEGQTIEINAQSTAMAMVTLHPLFLPVTGNDFKVVEDHIRAASSFQDLVGEVQKSISERRSLSDLDNYNLLIALNNVLDEICEGLDDEDMDFSAQTRASQARGVQKLRRFPMDIRLENKTLTFKTVKQTPSYIGETYNRKDGPRTFRVQGRDDFGMTDIWEWTKNWINTGNPSIYGEPTEVELEGSGEYRVDLQMDSEEAKRKILKNIITLFLPVGRAGNDIANAILSASQGILDLLLNQEITIEDACPMIMGVIQAEFTAVERVAADGGLKWASSVVKDIAGTLGIYFNIYGRMKNAANGAANWAYFCKCDKFITFSVCVGEKDASDCTEVNLDIVSGNNQEGESNQRLLLPLTVRTSFYNDELMGELVEEEGRYIKFTVISGDGKLSVTNGRTDKNGLLTTYWTLGEGNPGDIQKVRAVVVSNIDPTLEISEPVEFTAKVKETSDITVRLDWHKLSGNTDLDLHVVDPYGEEIYWYNPYSYLSGGQLDRDDRVGPGPEHIYFKKAPAGKYQVYVNYYDSDTQGVTSYKVTVFYGSEQKVYGGSIGYHKKIPITTITKNANSRSRSVLEDFKIDEMSHWPIQTTYPSKDKK